jgi:hypothetical protein
VRRDEGARAALRYSPSDVRKPPFHVRINGEIRGTPTVDLITSADEHVGIVPLAEALRRALAEGGDLLEIGPDRTPPVCKILNRAKLSYEAKARATEERREHRDSGLTIRVQLPTSFVLVSSDLLLVMPAFEACGRHGTGHAWQVVAQHLVDTSLREIAARVRFDADADTFRAESDDRAALELLRDRLDAILTSPPDLARVIAEVPPERWHG